MLTLSFGGSDEVTRQRVREKYPRLVVEIKKTLDAKHVTMQARIVRDKLSGQVLKHRTGKLANSIRFISATESGQTIAGGVEGAGGPAFYGRFHEFGTERSYEIKPVNAKALAFFPSGGSLRPGQQRTLLRNLSKGRSGSAQAFAEGGGVVVKSVIHPPITKRSYLVSTQDEMKQEIQTALQDTTNRVMSE